MASPASALNICFDNFAIVLCVISVSAGSSFLLINFDINFAHRVLDSDISLTNNDSHLKKFTSCLPHEELIKNVEMRTH